MAHFRAEIKGGRGSASRPGHKTTGIKGHTYGWSSGIRVEGRYDEDLECDVFVLYQTTGSSLRGGDKMIGKLVGEKFVAMENT